MKKYISFILCIILSVQLLPFSAFAEETSTETITFPQVTAEMLKNEMTNASGHPILIANESSFQKIKEYGFGKDSVITKQYDLIKDKASALLDAPLITITTDISQNSYIGKAVDFWSNIMALAFVYRVEGLESYAERAYEQTLVFCNMSSWGTHQLIDNVQVVFGVALCYDWLYDWLNNEQKQILIDSLNEKHLSMMSDLYNNPDKEEYKWAFHQHVFGSTNHTVMDNSLTFLAAMALADTNMDFYTDIMAHALKNLEKPFLKWYPDSAWPEGMSYWNFSGPYMARLFITMKNSFNHCFGYEDIPCLMNASDFPIYAQSSQGAFVWGNMYITANQRIPIIYSFGVLKDDIALQRYALENTRIDTRPDPVFCLMYNPLTEYSKEYKLSLDKLFRNTDIATMRNSHESTQQTWCAFGVQKRYGRNSGMMNSGTIGFDALGERWIMNHGRENYYPDYNNQSESRWRYYRVRAESQSCIVIDPSEHGGQNLNSESVIDTFVSSSGSAYAISDLTETYLGQASSYKRGVMLCNNRRSFVVQDELTMPKASEVYSFFNLYKVDDIEIGNDGKSAIVKKGNKKLYVSIDCDEDYTFGVMACEPLPTSPEPLYPNSPNPDFQKLYIHFDSVENVNIRVTFTPYLCDNELKNVKCTSFVPMSDWCIEENQSPVPVLTGIKLNDKNLEAFNSFDRYYEITDSELPSNLSAFADEDKYTVSVDKKNNGLLYEITVTDKQDESNINTYLVVLTHTAEISHPETTYTNSSFGGVMMPQEFYRIANGDTFSAMYFKDSAPKGCTKAVLTVYANVVGESFNTNLKQCILDAGTELKYLAGSNTTIKKSSAAKATLSAISKSSVFNKNMQKLEYDITAVLPESGGDFVFALLPAYSDSDYITLASHRNSDYSLRPQIKYYVETSK